MNISPVTSSSSLQSIFATTNSQRVVFSLITPVETSSTSVDISGLGKLLSAASILDRAIVSRAGMESVSLNTVVAATQIFVDAFNGFLQSNSLTNSSGDYLGGLFIQSLNSQSATASGQSILARLSEVGISYQAPSSQTATGTMTLNLSKLQSAYTADKAGTIALLSQATQAVGRFAASFTRVFVQMDLLAQLSASFFSSTASSGLFTSNSTVASALDILSSRATTSGTTTTGTTTTGTTTTGTTTTGTTTTGTTTTGTTATGTTATGTTATGATTTGATATGATTTGATTTGTTTAGATPSGTTTTGATTSGTTTSGTTTGATTTGTTTGATTTGATTTGTTTTGTTTTGATTTGATTTGATTTGATTTGATTTGTTTTGTTTTGTTTTGTTTTGATTTGATTTGTTTTGTTTTGTTTTGTTTTGTTTTGATTTGATTTGTTTTGTTTTGTTTTGTTTTGTTTTGTTTTGTTNTGTTNTGTTNTIGVIEPATSESVSVLPANAPISSPLLSLPTTSVSAQPDLTGQVAVVPTLVPATSSVATANPAVASVVYPAVNPLIDASNPAVAAAIAAYHLNEFDVARPGSTDLPPVSYSQIQPVAQVHPVKLDLSA